MFLHMSVIRFGSSSAGSLIGGGAHELDLLADMIEMIVRRWL